MRKTMCMIGIVSLILISLCLPAQATELLRLEAHWAAVDGWEHCGNPAQSGGRCASTQARIIPLLNCELPPMARLTAFRIGYVAPARSIGSAVG